MSKKIKVVLIILCIIASVVLIFNGAKTLFNEYKNLSREGNSNKYSLDSVEPKEFSPLSGMNILYLGSSVTNGSASLGTSFADYISKRNNTTFVKEAVNGTTLVEGKGSYIERLEGVKGEGFDLLICQLSTNDATRGLPLGEPSLTDNPDKSTICGAIEHIILYARERWDCPVVFYTGSYYESENYEAMVYALLEIAELYDIGVIDLYTDEEFNDITDEKRALYMADPIHPTRAGYLEWWTPRMEEYLYQYLSDKR